MRFLLICFFSLFSVSAFAQVAIDLGGAGGGGIRLGSSSDSCNASREGLLYWDGGCVQACDGTSWECIGGACDNAPHSFTFTDVTGASTSTLYESNIVQINGMDSGCNAIISVSGDGSPEWRLCSNATCSSEIQTWTTSNSSQDAQGNYLQIRTTSNAATSVTNSVTANVGNTSNVWTVSTVITGSCGATPTIGQTCADGTVYAGITPDGNVPMYITRCDHGMSWSGSACTGVRTSVPWNNGNSSGNVSTGTSSTSGDINTTNLIVLDSDSVTAGTQPHQAAQECADLNINGHTDWYLPARHEINLIYENLQDGTPNDNNPDPVITGFSTTGYFTSTEFTTGSVRVTGFDTGGEGNYGKNATNRPIRCARQD